MDINDKQLRISIEIDETDSIKTVISHLYGSLGLDEYRPYANLDGLEDLLTPDILVEDGFEITFINWEKVSTQFPVDANKLVETFKVITSRWENQGKHLTIKFQ